MEERTESRRLERALTVVFCTLVFVALSGMLWAFLVPEEPAYVVVLVSWSIQFWLPVSAAGWYDGARRELERGPLRNWARGIYRTGCILFLVGGLVWLFTGIRLLTVTSRWRILPPPRVSPHWHHAAFVVTGLLTLAGMGALWLRSRPTA